MGSELRLVDGICLVALAMNADGYDKLCELIILGRQRTDKGKSQLTREDFRSGLPGRLVQGLHPYMRRAAS